MENHPERCAAAVPDAGRCQLATGHDATHLAFADGAVLAWSVPGVELHRYSAYRVALWVRNAPWIAGFSPTAA